MADVGESRQMVRGDCGKPEFCRMPGQNTPAVKITFDFPQGERVLIYFSKDDIKEMSQVVSQYNSLFEGD